MPKPAYWIEYTADWRDAPMAYWVHGAPVGQPWHDAASYVPPAPPRIAHRGYALLCVAFGDVTLRFSSPAQLAEMIRVLACKPLPSTRKLCQHDAAGPNSHWLSRLPGKLKTPRTRQKLVQLLGQIQGAWPC